MQQFKGKSVFITGGARGIGAATAEGFAGMGARVCVTDVDVAAGTALVEKLGRAGAEAHFLPCDVSVEDDVQRAVEETVRRFGRLDVAFNNAGWEGRMGPLHLATTGEVDRLFAINIRGVFLGMKHQLAQMLRQGGGTIVNNASIAGLKGLPSAGVYAASKHAVVGMTRCAALDYATQAIRVNVVCPGVVDTEMIQRAAKSDPATLKGFADMQPIRRMGRPEEIASVVTWLCSDEASFVTGATIEADGGIMAG